MSAAAIMAAANKIAEDGDETSQVKSGQALILQLGKVAEEGVHLIPIFALTPLLLQADSAQLHIKASASGCIWEFS